MNNSISRKSSFRRRQKPPFAERAKESCRKLTAFMFTNVGIILLVVLYTIAGALTFIAIEKHDDKNKSGEIDKARTEYARKILELSCCSDSIFNDTEYKILLGNHVCEYQKKFVNYTLHRRITDMDQQWTIAGAFLYSLTVITTIGYGNITPRTNWGKIVTIIYAIAGMPLFLLYLSNIGDILAKSFKWIYAKVCLCRICPGLARRRAIRQRKKTRGLTAERDMDQFLEDAINISSSNYSGLNGIKHPRSEHSITSSTTTTAAGDDDFDDEDIDDIDAVLNAETNTVIVPLSTCVLIMIGYILFGALLFTRWEENWGWLNGSYFCFISLTSIGFGDFVPGDKVLQVKEQNIVEVSFILCAVYLLLGMALIAMCFNLMQLFITQSFNFQHNCQLPDFLRTQEFLTSAGVDPELKFGRGSQTICGIIL